jgi:predicted nucleic acid-binding Zn ribbon protein
MAPPKSPPPPEECANCGAAIPRNAKACPECGADERTGWRENSIYDGLDLPDDPDEPGAAGRPAARQVNGIAWYWWVVGAILLVLVVLRFVGR